MIKNSYFSIGFNDRKYLLQNLVDEEDAYNRQAVDCQQVVEKIMKGVLELVEMQDFQTKKSLLCSHNLKRIGKILNTELGLDINLEALAYLQDFYFEARYPGDNFVVITKPERDRCLEIMNEVLQKVERFIPNDVKCDAMSFF